MAQTRALAFTERFFLEPRPKPAVPPYRFQQWHRRDKFRKYVLKAANNFRLTALGQAVSESVTDDGVVPDVDTPTQEWDTADQEFFRNVGLNEIGEIVRELKSTSNLHGEVYDQLDSNISHDDDRVRYDTMAADFTAKGIVNADDEPYKAAALRQALRRLRVELQARLAELLRAECPPGTDLSAAVREFWKMLRY